MAFGATSPCISMHSYKTSKALSIQEKAKNPARPKTHAAQKDGRQLPPQSVTPPKDSKLTCFHECYVMQATATKRAPSMCFLPQIQSYQISACIKTVLSPLLNCLRQQPLVRNCPGCVLKASCRARD